jgi:adenine-specific DNA-methyltransferase
MNTPVSRDQIQSALKAFASGNLRDNARRLFNVLGYRSEKRIDFSPNTAEVFRETFDPKKQLKEKTALLDHWRSIDLLFQLTSDEVTQIMQGQLAFSGGRVDDKIIESYLFFAVDLTNDRYTRTQFADITREINKLFAMPVMVLFRHGDCLTLAIINRRLHRRDESKDVLEKVTLIKDIHFVSPHRAHIEILFDLSFDTLLARYAFTNFVALHTAWQNTLDTSVLNRRFYQELANWYFWALDHVTFPKEAPKDRDGRDSISLIRMVTRLIFCWFLKEKGLIPDDLFPEQKVRALLASLKEEENTYYTAILQNLFFATLNTEMDQPSKPPTRRFIDEGKDSEGSEDHMIHQVWRHAERIRDRATFERLLRGIPFLNGGLFECLDERIEQGASSHTHEVRVDGFSVKPAKQPKVPNFLFFGSERPVDLSKAYGELRYTQTKVRPLIPLLEGYKFTVSENTPVEEEVALDPELLGHVFENLLAAYNPETDKTARKTTGSFYTPRVVVDFMVDETLITYLESRLQAAITKPKSAFVPRLRQLLRYTDEHHQFSSEEVQVLVDAIDQVKILDPACGSGAFPMGALHKLVFLLGKLDPGNAAWKARQLAKARQLDVGREAALQVVEDAFARDQGDYGRKLYLIENCLYGVDIQPIAVQIAKLRCFISLVVEQEPDDTLPNLGILPLPNLETKFIAANTLFGLHRHGQMALVAHGIEAKQAELRHVRHEHFLARRYSEKKTLRKRDKKLREELAELLKSSQSFSGPEASMVADWDPYHADRSAAFFDPEWMFSLDSRLQRSPGTWRGNLSLINEAGGQMELISSRSITGFDIVIGNPPYVRQEELKKMKAFEGLPGLERPLKDALKEDYFCYTGVADLYVYFYEKAFDLLAPGGVLCFISSNKYFRAGYGERLRHFLAVNGEVRLLIDFGDEPVFTSIAYPSIILVRKTRETRDKHVLPSVPKDIKKWQGFEGQVRTLNWEPGPSIEEFPEILGQCGFTLPQRELRPDGWRLESPLKLRLLEKLRLAGPPLGEYVKGRFYRGVLTGLNEAFVINRATRDRLVAEHSSSAEIIKPWLRGRDVKRWRVEPQDLWLIFTRRGIDIKKYPAVYEYLKSFKKRLMPGVPGGRKPGSYEWYEIQDNIAYWQEFEQPKVVIPAITDDVEYAVDREAFYSNDKTSICVSERPEFLCALLNSKVLWWVMRQTAATKQGGFYEFKPMYVSKLPIAIGKRQSEQQITQLAKKVIAKKKTDPNTFVGDLEAELDGLVAHLYGLTEDEYRLILDNLALPDLVRVGALNAYRETARGFAK